MNSADQLTSKGAFQRPSSLFLSKKGQAFASSVRFTLEVAREEF